MPVPPPLSLLSLSSSACARRAARGFTTVELVVVIVILGIMAAVVLPSVSDSNAFRAAGFHDQVVAALRYGQKSAVSHRRLVCANLTSTTVTLTIAASNPAAGCGAATLTGPDGDTAFARSADAAATVSSTPGGPIYFQPSGVATSAAAVITDYTVTVSGTPAINVTGATGRVE